MRCGFVAAFVAALLVTSPVDARGQSRSLEELRTTLRTGDRIRVINHDGTVVDGDFDGVSGSSVRLIRKRTVLELPESQIDRIRRPRHEADGILVGLGLGAAAGLSFVLLRCSESSESVDCRRAGSVIMIGPTAAAGALIDRAFTRFDTIFDRDTASPRQVRVTPILTDRHKGVAVTLVY